MVSKESEESQVVLTSDMNRVDARAWQSVGLVLSARCTDRYSPGKVFSSRSVRLPVLVRCLNGHGATSLEVPSLVS